MTDIDVKKLEELAEIKTGRGLSKSNPEYWGGEIPRAKASDLDSLFLEETEDQITEKGKEEMGMDYIVEDSVVLSARGNIGAMSLLQEPMLISQDLKALVTNPDEVNSEYLLYYLKNKQERLEELASGSTVKSLTNQELGKIEVQLPPLEVQEEIVEKINSLIESRDKTEEHLDKVEEVKQKIMTKLFREGINDNPIREEPIYGRMPENWELMTLKEVSEIRMGKSPSKDELNEKREGTPFVRDGRDLGLKYPEFSKSVEEPLAEVDEKHLLILVRGNDAGKTNIADRDYSIGRGIAGIKPDEEHLLQEFLHYYLNYRQERIEQLSGSDTTTWISKRDLQKLKVPVPPKSEQQNLVEVLDTIDEVMGKDNELMKKTGKLKKSLFGELLDSPNNYNDGEQV